AARLTGPVVSLVAFASVTEMRANRGSTASSKVSRTSAGGLLRSWLADGNVLIRYACADAATGSASPTSITAIANPNRARRVTPSPIERAQSAAGEAGLRPAR